MGLKHPIYTTCVKLFYANFAHPSTNNVENPNISTSLIRGNRIQFTIRTIAQLFDLRDDPDDFRCAQTTEIPEDFPWQTAVDNICIEPGNAKKKLSTKKLKLECRILQRIIINFFIGKQRGKEEVTLMEIYLINVIVNNVNFNWAHFFYVNIAMGRKRKDSILKYGSMVSALMGSLGVSFEDESPQTIEQPKLLTTKFASRMGFKNLGGQWIPTSEQGEDDPIPQIQGLSISPYPRMKNPTATDRYDLQYHMHLQQIQQNKMLLRLNKQVKQLRKDNKGKSGEDEASDDEDEDEDEDEGDDGCDEDEAYHSNP